MLFKIF